MWSTVFLCLLVGFAAASSDYAWKSDTEYEYYVRGRTLASLHQVDDQYAGITMKALLHIQRRSEEVLICRLSDAQYAQLHAKLPQGWHSAIPEQQLSYRPMQLTGKSFEIQMKNGTVQEFIVEQNIPNWEANIIKSVISQIQVDVQGENMIKSRYNQPYERDSVSISAEYKTMEDTVTGKCETLYDIAELPEYQLQTEPELVPQPHLKGDGEFIEVVKTKNYSNCDERIVYHYGLAEMEDWEPAAASYGDFFSKSSVSRIILSGTLKRHTIQSSVTTNKIVVKPTPNAQQQGIVVSQLNITLANVKASSGQPQQLSNPKNLGNLVYRYNSPYAGNNEAREGSHNSAEHNYDKDSSSSSSSSSEENHQHNYEDNASRHPRHRRAAQQQNPGRYDDSSSSSSSSSSEEITGQWQQDKPSMNSPPEIPLLPYNIGYMGSSIKNAQNINIVQEVQKLAKQIGQELQNPSDIPKQDTLAKFIILSNLIRSMNVKELDEASRDLYNKKSRHEREETDTWRVYRDAVAQAGTCPALQLIKEWIQKMNIRGARAACVIATAANSVRTPTDEYMRTFYTLATDSKVQEEPFLNDTAILSFAELVRKVYIRKEVSHNEYPVHVFGAFHNQNNDAVYKEYIPYLAQQMHEAIKHAETHKIHVYIRALGNIGDRKILEAFEPYLEGQKQISQFQRLFMVVSMDKLVLTNPKTARSVLYKIYQNEGELPEIRVAALHQLMRTSPPASMLQRMAEATHFESSDQVTAAVKSAIQSASELEHPDYYELATNAQAAVPFLNPEPYGFQYSKSYLIDYLVEEMNVAYKQHATFLGSEDSSYPQGIMYNLRGNMAGLKRQYMNIAAVVSNVEDLVQVIEDQTQKDDIPKYQTSKDQSQWAADSIAHLLKIHYEEREQLEGNLQFGFGGVRRFFTFDNHTIENLPSWLKSYAPKWKDGQEFNFTKIYNPYDMTLSFPTAMGLPFVYTLDTPTLLSFHGKIQAVAHPEIVNNKKIQTPEYVNMTCDIRVTVSHKTQAKLGFVTPFDHQHYIAGYDKNVQLHLPLRANIDIDVENQEVRAEYEPLDDQSDEVFHYSTWPYTAKHDILDLKPVSRISSHQLVQQREPQTYEYVYGKKAGMAFRVNYTTEREFADFKWLYDIYQRHEGLAKVMSPLFEDSLVYNEFSVEYDNELSHADSVIFQMGWNDTYFSGLHHQEKVPDFNEVYSKADDLSDSDDRQEYFLQKAAAGINNADAYVYDFSVQFCGKESHEYNYTLAYGTSSVDKVSRVLFYYNKDASNDKDYEACFYAQNTVPNTNGLDFVYALKFDPTIKSDIKFAYGEKCQSGGKVNVHVKLEQSEERQRYLQSRPLAQLCREEMKHGDQQLYACRNMTARANLLDQYSFDISYENIGQQARNWTHKLHNAFHFIGYPYLDENILEGHGQPNKIKVDVDFEPNYKAVNVSFETEKMQTEYNQIRLNEWAKAAFVVHPVFDIDDRLYGQMENEVYNPTCVVDQNMMETFDNRTYPMELGQPWHVVMQYREQPAGRQQDKQQYRFHSEDDYDYEILASDSSSGNHKKVLKIVLNNAKNYYEVEMTPVEGSHSGSQPAAKVNVNQQEVTFDDHHAYDIEDDLLKIYALPNQEVKIEVNDDFYVIYDGERAKLTIVNADKFRGEVRGLCGTMDGEEDTDFLTPKNCILRKPLEFAATYAILESSYQGPLRQRQAQANQSPCYYRDVIYANVISPRDYRSEQKQRPYGQGQQKHDSCTKHQTQYVEEDGGETLCFSVRPLPVCHESCKAEKKIVKNVDVHCVQRNNVSELWKKQIQKGASPDFSHKAVTKTIKIKVAQSCKH